MLLEFLMKGHVGSNKKDWWRNMCFSSLQVLYKKKYASIKSDYLKYFYLTFLYIILFNFIYFFLYGIDFS